MSAITKEADGRFMSDIYWQRAIVWLTENVGSFHEDAVYGNSMKKAWGHGWYAMQEQYKGKWLINYLVDDDMLAVQFKLIHG